MIFGEYFDAAEAVEPPNETATVHDDNEPASHERRLTSVGRTEPGVPTDRRVVDRGADDPGAQPSGTARGADATAHHGREPGDSATRSPSPAGLSLPPAPRRDDRRGPSRSFSETGFEVRGPFLAFYEHFGPTLCGPPISGEVVVDGRRTQYFRHIALEEHAPGRVRPRALGDDWLALARAVRGTDAEHVRRRVSIVDLVDALPSGSGAAYPNRPLSHIRYLVVHETGAAPDVTPQQIAHEHVATMGWPGIGYHYVVGADGTIWRTQDLTIVSHHARQFNPAAVGIALCGNFTASPPGAVQIHRTAALLADLLDQLGLPPEVIRGHGEMVPTGCPGATFLTQWKPRLMAEVARCGGEVHR